MERLPVSVIKLIAQMEKGTKSRAQRGVYEITYQAEENYQGLILEK